jgi:hypothetical protein
MSDKEADDGTTTTTTADHSVPNGQASIWRPWPVRAATFDGDGLLVLRLCHGAIEDRAQMRSELYRLAVASMQERYSAEFQGRWSTCPEVAQYQEVADRLAIAVRDLEAAIVARGGLMKQKGGAIMAASGTKAAKALAAAREALDSNRKDISDLRDLVNLLVPEAETAREAAQAKRDEIMQELEREAFDRYEKEVQSALAELCDLGGLLDRLALTIRCCGMADALGQFILPPQLPPVPLPPADFQLPEFESKSAYTFPTEPPPEPPPKPARPRHPADEYAVVDGGRMKRGFVSFEEAQDYASGRPHAQVRKISGPGSLTETSWTGTPTDDHE